MAAIIKEQLQVVSEEKKKYDAGMKKAESLRIESIARYDKARGTLRVTWLAYLLELARAVVSSGKSITFYDPAQRGHPYKLAFEPSRVIEMHSKGYLEGRETRRVVEKNPVDYVKELYKEGNTNIRTDKVKGALQQISESGFARRIRRRNVLGNFYSLTSKKPTHKEVKKVIREMKRERS